jgi:hypothetical protein
MLDNLRYGVTKTLMTFMGPADFGSESHSDRLRKDHNDKKAEAHAPRAEKAAGSKVANTGDYQI